MNDDLESVQILENIIKNGAEKFKNDISENLNYDFSDEEKDDEKCILFRIYFGAKHDYLISLKKLKTESESIPSVKGYTKMDLQTNPYRKLVFTDENEILGNIYDSLESLRIDEIACYEKFGIILRNPLNLKGLYNISIKYINN